MKNSIFILIIMLTFLTKTSFAQITFQKTFEGANAFPSFSCIKVSGGGYVIVGPSGLGGSRLIRTDNSGDTLWTRIYSGSFTNTCYSVQEAIDGGFILAGKLEISGAPDLLLMKTDNNGYVTYANTYGGSSSDYGWCVKQTADGGSIIAGTSGSLGFGAGSFDIYIVRTDVNGDSLWTRCFGGPGSEQGYFIEQTNDGGFVFTGTTNGYGVGNNDAYMTRLDSFGNFQWSKTYGGAAFDDCKCIKQTKDDGYIMVGTTESFGTGNNDVYLLKTDSTGTITWSKTYGGNGNDFGSYVLQTSDSGYLITGYTESFGGMDSDVYLIKTNINGDLMWAKTYGGSGTDDAYSCEETSDGGFIIAGRTHSFGFINGNVYLIKTDSLGNSGCNEGNTSTIVTTPPTQSTDILMLTNSPPTIFATHTMTTSNGNLSSNLCLTVETKELLSGSGFDVFPNPASGNFIIKSGNIINYGKLEIYNATGKLIFNKIINYTANVDLNLYCSPGIYLIRLIEYDKSTTRKIIIK